MKHRYLSIFGLTLGLLAGSASASSVLITFDQDASGTDWTATTDGSKPVGQAIGSSYETLGVRFIDAKFESCGGGCRPDVNGLYAKSNLGKSFGVVFSAAQSWVSFYNISNSYLTAEAYETYVGFGAGQSAIASISDVVDNNVPRYLELGSKADGSSGSIGFVRFMLSTDYQDFGIDDLAFASQGSFVGEQLVIDTLPAETQPDVIPTDTNGSGAGALPVSDTSALLGLGLIGLIRSQRIRRN